MVKLGFKSRSDGLQSKYAQLQDCAITSHVHRKAQLGSHRTTALELDPALSWSHHTGWSFALGVPSSILMEARGVENRHCLGEGGPPGSTVRKLK